MKFWMEVQTEIDEFRKKIVGKVESFTKAISDQYSIEFQRISDEFHRTVFIGVSTEGKDMLLSVPTLFIEFPSGYPYTLAAEQADKVLVRLGEIPSQNRLQVKPCYQPPESVLRRFEPKGAEKD